MAEPIELHIDKHGAGPPLVLLHGLGSTHADWDLVAPSFAGEREVWLPDMRGHGESPRPAGEYTVPQHAADVAAALDKAGVKNTAVVGLSMGGMIALQLAVDRPDLVGALVVVNSGPSMRRKTVGDHAAIFVRLALLSLFGPARFGRMIAKRLFPRPEQQVLRDELADRLGKNPRDVYLRQTRGLLSFDVDDRIGAIRCPTLAIASDHDYTPIDAKREWAARIPGARLEVLANSGHAATVDAAPALTRLIRDFLASTAH
jgi:pimeloyl-ACP methyl ester carboxylesterase